MYSPNDRAAKHTEEKKNRNEYSIPVDDIILLFQELIGQIDKQTLKL